MNAAGHQRCRLLILLKPPRMAQLGRFSCHISEPKQHGPHTCTEAHRAELGNWLQADSIHQSELLAGQLPSGCQSLRVPAASSEELHLCPSSRTSPHTMKLGLHQRTTLHQLFKLHHQEHFKILSKSISYSTRAIKAPYLYK